MKYSQAIFVAVVGGAALAAAAPTVAPVPAAPAVQGEQTPLAPAAANAGKKVEHHAKVEVTEPVEGAKPHKKTTHRHGTENAHEGHNPATGTRRQRHKKGAAQKAIAKPEEVAATSGHPTKHHRKSKAKAEKSVETPKAAEVTKPGATPVGTTTEAKAARDVEEFFERSFDDGLEARMFESLWRAFTPHKHAAHKEAKPTTVTASSSHTAEEKSNTHHTHATHPETPAAAPATEAVTPETPAQAPLASRNIMDDDELVARYLEEIDARGLWSRVKGFFGKKQAPPADAGYEQRDFNEEDELLARFEEEIEARGLWSRVKGFFGKKQAPPADAGYEQRDFDEDLFERDFDEELFERDFDDLELRGLWSRVKGFFGKKQAPPADAGYEQRDFDEEDLFERDLYDEEELFGRDFYDEEDLMARDVDVLDALEAVKKTFTPPHHARELFDELDARDFADWELEELD